MRSYRIYVVFVSLLGLFVQNVSSTSTSIESEGVAAIVKGNLDIARDNAIEDGLRKAVEQATGSLVENQTLVDNYQLLSDKIYSRSRGYVQSYEVIDEKVDQGLYRVTIQASVANGDLINDLLALNLLMRQARKPRIMVLFEDTEAEGVRIGKMAEDSISKALLTRGFELVDAEFVRHNLDHTKMMGLLTGDERMAAVVGSKYGAEMLLLGSAQAVTSRVAVGDITINSNQVVISVRLLRADTGEIEASETRRAVKPHVNSLTGIQMATDEASETLVSDLVERIVKIFREQIYNVASVKLIILGLQDYGQLQEVIRLISNNVRGVQEVYQRNYAMGKAELEVELSGNTESLAGDLTARPFGIYRFVIRESTHNQLQVFVNSIDP